jgi:hypothetical protein
MLVDSHDGRYPSSYLDRNLDEILAYFEISLQEFNDVCDDYTNYDLFLQDSAGQLVRRKDGSPELAGSFSCLHP